MIPLDSTRNDPTKYHEVVSAKWKHVRLVLRVPRGRSIIPHSLVVTTPCDTVIHLDKI
jgi:hypothetical protein